LSSSGGAMRAQLRSLRRLVPKLPEKQRPHTVPCQQCGKLVAANDAIMGLDKNILCKECYNTLHVAKNQTKE